MHWPATASGRDGGVCGMRLPARRPRAAWESRASGARDVSPRAPGVRGTADRTRRPTSPACRGGNTRGSPAPESAASRRRGMLPSPSLGFFLDHGHGDADQPVQLIGARFGKESFAPCPLALAERVEQAAHEREQRHALELHATQLLSRFLLALRQAFVAVCVAETLRRERSDDLDEADVS